MYEEVVKSFKSLCVVCGSLASCARDKAEAAVERDRTRSNRQNGHIAQDGKST